MNSSFHHVFLIRKRQRGAAGFILDEAEVDDDDDDDEEEQEEGFDQLVNDNKARLLSIGHGQRWARP